MRIPLSHYAVIHSYSGGPERHSPGGPHRTQCVKPLENDTPVCNTNVTMDVASFKYMFSDSLIRPRLCNCLSLSVLAEDKNPLKHNDIIHPGSLLGKKDIISRCIWYYFLTDCRCFISDTANSLKQCKTNTRWHTYEHI